MGNKLISIVGTLMAVGFFGHLLWSGYDNITLGRKQCEDQCLKRGGVEFVWVPETRKSWWQTGPVNEVQSSCTCITSEEKAEIDKNYKSIMETIKKHNRENMNK